MRGCLFAGASGFDAVTVDLQHGLVDYQQALVMMQALGRSRATILARPPSNEPGVIGRLLDAGAMGIICPMVNTAVECGAFVAACR